MIYFTGTPVRDIPGRKRVAVRRRRPPPPPATRVAAGQVPTAAVSGQSLESVGQRQEDTRASNPRLAPAQRTTGGQASGNRAVVPRRPVALGSEQASR